VTAVALAGVRKAFGPVRVLQEVTLALAPGERLTLLGPSGCGKSVLLRIVAGLERPDGGAVTFDGGDVTRVPARDRGAALVSADRVLLPYAGPGWPGWPFFRRRPPLVEQEVAARLAVVRGVLGDAAAEQVRRSPESPPGGESVPLAVARSLSLGARLLLLDDPLARLAAGERGEARAAIGDLLRRSGATALFATHDEAEAAALGEGLAVMRSGRIEQVGPYQELYRRPATLFVAGYLGGRAMNLVRGVVTADGRYLAPPAAGDGRDGWAVPLPPPATAGVAPGTTLTLGIRGEALRLAADGEVGVAAHVLDVGPPAGGERRLVTCALGAAGAPGPVLVAELPLPAERTPPADTPLRLAFDADQVHLFDAAGARLDGLDGLGGPHGGERGG
jgi:ABC-type sugar transport system ATPase subunit